MEDVGMLSSQYGDGADVGVGVVEAVAFNSKGRVGRYRTPRPTMRSVTCGKRSSIRLASATLQMSPL